MKKSLLIYISLEDAYDNQLISDGAMETIEEILDMGYTFEDIEEVFVEHYDYNPSNDAVYFDVANIEDILDYSNSDDFIEELREVVGER